ncbi:hypothetical protein FQZ97_879350 [compost metagenome]
MQGHSLIDGFLLVLLGAAPEQHNQRVTFLGQINTVAGAPVDLVFTDATKPGHVGRVAQFHPGLGHGDFGGGHGIQLVEPLLIGVGAVFPDVLFESYSHAVDGNDYVTFSQILKVVQFVGSGARPHNRGFPSRGVTNPPPDAQPGPGGWGFRQYAARSIRKRPPETPGRAPCPASARPWRVFVHQHRPF